MLQDKNLILKKNFYREFISKRSNLINLNINNFLNQDERFFIWNVPRQAYEDFHGREPSIFQIRTPQILAFLENKLKKPHLKYHNFIIDNICLLRLDKPTKPHIDGHYPVVERDNKKYCITKTCIIPIAFDTNLKNSEDIETSVVTFKQHYNHYVNGGLEFDILYSKNKKYTDFDFEDSNNNILKKHENSFITDENIDMFAHIADQYKGVLTYGIDIENIYKMNIGTLITMNPYQMHCTTNYNKTFSSKWVLRFLICEKLG